MRTMRESFSNLSPIDFVRMRIVSFFPRTPFGLRMIRLCMPCGYASLRLYWFLFRPAAVGVQCVISCEGQVLLIRNTYGRRLWTVPGGGIKAGEKPETAVRREVSEEVGLVLDTVRPLGMFHGRDEYRYDTVHAFSSQIENPTCTTDPGEILEARWFVMNGLPPLADYAQRVLKLWHERGCNSGSLQ
jgi:8-oxo-dGTP pyrophosphatase MutT (NUDIX family)